MIKKSFIRICIICLVALAMPSVISAETAGVFYDSNVEQIKFAAEDVRTALESKSFIVEMLPLSSLDASYSNKKVVIALAANSEVKSMLTSLGADIPTELVEQAYGIRTTSKPDKSYWVLGGDENGAMYGGLQVAENIKFNSFTGTYNTQESPALLKRGIKLNYPLDRRSPTYGKRDNGTFEGIAYRKAIPHVWDFDYWTEWFDHMARNRYNVVSIWLCHPFTSLVKMANYPDVAIQNIQGFDGYEKTMTNDQKIDFWRKVMRYAHDRGFEFYFVNWNIFTYGATNKYGIDNKIDNQATKTYMYECMKALLETYPDLDGFGITAGEKMDYNQHAKNAQWLWGRLAYNPNTPDDVFKNHMSSKYQGVSSGEIFEAWKKASSGVPKVSELVGGTLYFDFHWWPEGCQIGRSKTNSSFVTIDRFIGG